MGIVRYIKLMTRPLRIFFVNIVIQSFENLGFKNHHRWYLNGPAERLIINDQNIDVKKREGYADALFNTRSGKVVIGKNVIFGHGVQVLTGRHDDTSSDELCFKETIPFGFDIHINDGCWITTNVIIIGGVSIGKNTTVLPGSVVTKSLPCRCVAGGIPARVIRFKEFHTAP